MHTTFYDFITKLPEAMQQVPDLQALLDAMEDMDANALTEWQATKMYSKLTGHKTVCVAKDFLPLLLNALHMVHTGKPNMDDVNGNSRGCLPDVVGAGGRAEAPWVF